MVRSCRWMSGVRLAVAVGMVMVGLTPAPLPAAAAVGDLLRTVVLPAGGGPEGEFCISGVGTSVAIVTGASVGTFIQHHLSKPLDADFYIGLPIDLEPRVAVMIAPRREIDMSSLPLSPDARMAIEKLVSLAQRVAVAAAGSGAEQLATLADLD